MRIAVPLALAVILQTVQTNPAFAQIVLHQLEQPEGATAGRANGINTLGHIAGVTSNDTSPVSRAVVWIDDRIAELPRVCAACNSFANDINDRGDTVGNAVTADGFTHGALWRDGSITSLPPLPGHHFATALSINNSAVIVGYSMGSDEVTRPVRWVDGVPQDLGHIDGLDMPWGVALAINDAGEIVGAVRPLDGQQERAFVWRNGAMTMLESPSGGACATLSAALANNDRNQIVGYVFVDCQQTAAVWDHGTLTILPALSVDVPGGSALDVNEHGDIVGLGNPIFGPAVLWRGGVAHRLTSPDPYVPTWAATDVNDDGVAVGFGQAADGVRAVKWTTRPRGLQDELNDLIDRVQNLGPGRSLAAKLRAIANQPSSGCGVLSAFAKEVRAQTGKTLLPSEAAALLEAADRIGSLLGC